MSFSVDELPDTAEERSEYVQEWADEEGFEVTEPSFISEGDEYSLTQMTGMAPETGSAVIDTLVFRGEEMLPPELEEVVSIDPGNDNPDLAPTLTAQDLDRHWDFIPYRAENHAEANIPGNDVSQRMLDEYGGLMMAEVVYDDTKVADVLLGPVFDAHTEYDAGVTDAMREESSALATAAEDVLGYPVETSEDLYDLEILFYETSEVPVSDEGDVTDEKPAVVSWYTDGDQLYLVPERVSVAVGDEDSTGEAYIGSVRGGYVDLGGDIQAPFPPLPDEDNPLESEQDYFTTLHNI